MKCPVCEKEIDVRKKQCDNCGFDRFKKEFLNQEEYDLWMTNTVVPCREVFQFNKLRLIELINERADYGKIISKLLKAVDENKISDDLMVDAAMYACATKYYETDNKSNRLIKENDDLPF